MNVPQLNSRMQIDSDAFQKIILTSATAKLTYLEIKYLPLLVTEIEENDMQSQKISTIEIYKCLKKTAKVS